MILAPNKQTARTGVSFAAELAFDAIHLHYGAVHTLKGITLTVAPGEVLCLLGPSGSGKTSLLRVAAGLEPQTSGTVSMNGQVIAGAGKFVAPEKRSVGLMFQDFALFPHMTVLDNVRFGLTDLSAGMARQEALAAIRRVGLMHHADSYPDVLSGGEQQRVALARALAPRPSVMLMDEPFSGLDTRLKDTIRAQTLAILRETRATTIVVTHDAEEAMRMGDRIALLDGGQILQTGTAEDIYSAPRNLFCAGFFSELNIFPAVVKSRHVDTPLGRFSADGFSEGAAVQAAIRTSSIDIQVAKEGDKGIWARITGRRFLGDFEQITLAVNGAETPVNARVRAGELAHAAKDVIINVRNNAIMLFESTTQNA